MIESELRTTVLELLARRPDITGPQIAGYTTFASATCKHMLGGQKPPSPRMIEEYTVILDRIERGEILKPGGDVVRLTEPAHAQRPTRKARDFYVTETVRSVAQVLGYCNEHAKIGVITAEYGVGKSESLRHWRTNTGASIDHLVFEFDDFTSRAVVDFMNAMGSALGMKILSGAMNGGKNFRAVIDHLQNHPMLLIFDQCETIQPRIAQVIRQLWDHTRSAGVGVVMLASPLLIQRLNANRAKDLGALTSRVGVWAPLRGIAKEEASYILKQEGVEQIDDAAFALLWRACSGSMRRLMAVIDMLNAKHKGKPVGERTIQGVAANLWGMDIAIARGTNQ